MRYLFVDYRCTVRAMLGCPLYVTFEEKVLGRVNDMMKIYVDAVGKDLECDPLWKYLKKFFPTNLGELIVLCWVRFR